MTIKLEILFHIVSIHNVSLNRNFDKYVAVYQNRRYDLED